MRKTILISAITFIAILVGIPTEAGPAQQDRSRRKVLIGFKKDSGRQTTESRRSLIRGHGGRARRSYRNISAMSAELSDSQISSLRADPGVAYIEEDGLLYALDAELENSWGVNRIGAGQIHTFGNKGANIKIALIDTGIDLDHPDLAVAGNVTFVDDTTNGNDDNGHGTHCAGIIAALDNGTGVVGVAPDALIYAVKALDSSGSGYLSDVAAGIDWAIDNGMNIISLSLGTNYDYQTLRDACERANTAGILVVAAAGNDYRNRRGNELDTVDYPARYDSVVAVGAIDDTDTKAYFSSTGLALELTAPGVWITSTYIGGGYAIMSGTSMACPHVVGVAALVLSGPGGDARTILQETADDLGNAGQDNWYGYGLVNAEMAAYQPADIHDIAVTSITAPSQVVQGDTITIEVTVANQGTHDETFIVSLTDDLSQITGQSQSITLVAGGYTTVEFSSNTASANANTTHKLTATAGPVPNETDTADNSMSTQVFIEPAFIDIAITAIEIPSPVVQGGSVDLKITIENLGNRDVSTPITFSLLDTPPVNGSPGKISAAQIIDNLESGATITLTFSWNTATASLGEHRLKASHNFQDQDSENDSKDTVVNVVEKPAEPEEFTFNGMVAPRQESGHTVTISADAMMYVNLSWYDRNDLRLRIYNPYGAMVAEVDSSTWQNRTEEIAIDVGPGNWRIAAKSDGRWWYTDYTIDVIVTY